MERTNKRTCYTLTGTENSYSFNFEVTKYEDNSRFEMNGNISKESNSYWCNYSVNNGQLNISINGSESGYDEVSTLLKSLAETERETQTEA